MRLAVLAAVLLGAVAINTAIVLFARGPEHDLSIRVEGEWDSAIEQLQTSDASVVAAADLIAAGSLGGGGDDDAARAAARTAVLELLCTDRRPAVGCASW